MNGSVGDTLEPEDWPARGWHLDGVAIHWVIVTRCGRFRAGPQSSLDLHAWQFRFIALEMFFGLGWTFRLVKPVGADRADPELSISCCWRC